MSAARCFNGAGDVITSIKWWFARLFTDIRSPLGMGFPPERVVRCYGDDLRYDDPKYGRDRVGYTIAARQCEIPGLRLAAFVHALVSHIRLLDEVRRSQLPEFRLLHLGCRERHPAQRMADRRHLLRQGGCESVSAGGFT